MKRERGPWDWAWCLDNDFAPEPSSDEEDVVLTPGDQDEDATSKKGHGSGGGTGSSSGGNSTTSDGGGHSGSGNTIDGGDSGGEEDAPIDLTMSQDRLIKDEDKGYRGFPGFFACHWSQGEIYPFVGAPLRPHSTVPGSPISRVRMHPFVSSVNMRSSYRVHTTFVKGDQMLSGTGTAIAIGFHTLVTAGRNVVPMHKDGEEWLVKEIRVCAGEYVPITKVRSFGYRCFLLSLENSFLPAIKGKGACVPETGADIAFLKVEESLPCFLLPCSLEMENKSQEVVTTVIGYPAARDFLKKAVVEFSTDADGDLWKNYEAAMANEVGAFFRTSGDFRVAKKLAKDKLLHEFRNAVRGIPDGGQACSAGKVDSASTVVCIAHTCPSLPGSSGSALSPHDYPGYFIGVHSGGVQPNMNIATSTDCPEFIRAYCQHVLPSLPAPHNPSWRQNSLAIGPFQKWLARHRLEWRSDGTALVPQMKKKWRLDNLYAPETKSESLSPAFAKQQPSRLSA